MNHLFACQFRGSYLESCVKSCLSPSTIELRWRHSELKHMSHNTLVFHLPLYCLLYLDSVTKILCCFLISCNLLVAFTFTSCGLYACSLCFSTTQWSNGILTELFTKRALKTPPPPLSSEHRKQPTSVRDIGQYGFYVVSRNGAPFSYPSRLWTIYLSFYKSFWHRFTWPLTWLKQRVYSSSISDTSIRISGSFRWNINPSLNCS
jgi:hypothetical protein